MYGKPTESTEYLDEIEVKDLKRPKPPPAPEAAFATTEGKLTSKIQSHNHKWLSTRQPLKSGPMVINQNTSNYY